MVDETTHHSSPTTTIVSSWPPVGSPHVPVDSAAYQEAEHLGHFDNSVNAVSFGFVATAILISMFLVMAIFERFLRPGNPSSRDSRNNVDVELGKFRYPSPKMTVYANGVSVLMPGDTIPTFIAHPVPVPVVAAPESDSPRPPPSPPPQEGTV